MKKIIVGCVMLFTLLSCGNETQVENKEAAQVKVVAENEKIMVSTSIVPLASITNYIGGDKVEVENIVGVGVSPHNFSLTPQNMINISKSDVVFLLGMQDIDGFLFKSLSGVKSIALDDGLQVLEPTSEHDHSDHEEHGEDEDGHDDHSEESHDEHGHDEHSDEEHSEDEHEHGDEGVHKAGYEEEVNEYSDNHFKDEYKEIIDMHDNEEGHSHDHDDHSEEEHSDEEHDEHEESHDDEGDVNEYLAEEGEGHVHAEASIDPHVWGGKVNALLMAKKIQEELSALQPNNKEIFEKNYQNFEVEITKIFDDFTTAVEGKNQKEFIVFHDAYNYLLFDAGIDINKKLVFRSNVMSDPSSAKMKELTDEVTLHGITNFFVEPQFEDKALTVFAEENNGTISRLDPLGSSVEADGFLGNIKSNLEALTTIYE